jgi:hypothetical protein
LIFAVWAAATGATDEIAAFAKIASRDQRFVGGLARNSFTEQQLARGLADPARSLVPNWSGPRMR